MNTEEIQKFLDKKTSAQNEYVKISFRKREAICGLFVKGHRDYSELASKNFWRIVPESRFASYQRTGDVGLAKIFCGTDFTRLSVVAAATEG